MMVAPMPEGSVEKMVEEQPLMELKWKSQRLAQRMTEVPPVMRRIDSVEAALLEPTERTAMTRMLELMKLEEVSTATRCPTVPDLEPPY